MACQGLALGRLRAVDQRRPALACPWGSRLLGGAEEVALAWRRGEGRAEPAGPLERQRAPLPPEGLSLVAVVPAAGCVWDDEACRWTCSRCPDGLAPLDEDGPVRIHRAASPGRLRPPCLTWLG